MREDKPTFFNRCGATCGRDVKAVNLIVQGVRNHDFAITISRNTLTKERLA